LFLVASSFSSGVDATSTLAEPLSRFAVAQGTGVEEQPLKRLLRTLAPSGAWLEPRAACGGAAAWRRRGGAAARQRRVCDDAAAV